MTTKYRPNRMRLNPMEKLAWDKVWSFIDPDTDMNEQESSGTDNPISLIYNNRSTLIGQRTSFVYEGLTGDAFGKGDFEITYDFSSAPRNNWFTNVNGKRVKYGSDGWSFRTLYEFLCATYCGGEYFIDSYFEKWFAFSPARNAFEELKAELNAGIIDGISRMRMLGPENMTERGKLSRFVREQTGDYLRNKKGQFASVASPDSFVEEQISKALSDGGWAKLLSSHKTMIEIRMREVAKVIKEDIKHYLDNSMLTRWAADGTIKRRKYIPDMQYHYAFGYASGQLIDDMKIYIQLDSGGWGRGKHSPQMKYSGYHGSKVVGGNL